MKLSWIVIGLCISLLSFNERTSEDFQGAEDEIIVKCQFRPLKVKGRWEINFHVGKGPVYDKKCIVGGENEYSGLSDDDIIAEVKSGRWTLEDGWRYECPE